MRHSGMSAWGRTAVAAMTLTAALAARASAQNQVPLKGTMQGNDIDSPGPSPTTVVVTTNGTGISTLLGHSRSLNK
jgi:hypothetical protein